MDIEDQGKPVVALVNKGFVKDARSAASSRNMPTLRILPENVRSESTVQADIEKGVAEVMDDIVAGLTKPLTPEERAPKNEAKIHPKIAFKGNYQEVNHHFYSRGWTDGLPIVPPTEAAVAEMLTGTDLPRDHVIGKIIPRLGNATVEKIAINAVMAGALPTHMPVLIAAVELLCDYGTRFDIFEVSTGSWAPFVLINGPVRHDINLNTSSGALSPGDMANSTIGRAIGLIVRNIGGARKGIEDMGTLGNPAKYSLVLGEAEEESPWEPWHVERGFKKEDSTVTMFFPNQYIQSTARVGTDAKGILDSIAGYAPRIMSSLVIIPSHAEILASEGWDKKKVREYVMKLGDVPSAGSRPQSGDATASAAGAKPSTPQGASMETVRGIGLTKPANAMPTTPRDALMIVVAGGPGAWFGLHRSAGGGIIGNDFISKKIQLPKNWSKLVAKYKNLVPDYELY